MPLFPALVSDIEHFLQYNYGGIQIKDVQVLDSISMSQNNLSQNDPEVSQPDIISSWNIAEYLPKVTQVWFFQRHNLYVTHSSEMGKKPVVIPRTLNGTNIKKFMQDYFIVVVSEFLYIPWKHAQEQAKLRAAAKACASTSCTPSVTVAAAANAEFAEATFLKDQVKLSCFIMFFSKDVSECEFVKVMIDFIICRSPPISQTSFSELLEMCCVT